MRTLVSVRILRLWRAAMDAGPGYLTLILLLGTLIARSSANTQWQPIRLSDSYLPASLQVLAHFIHQLHEPVRSRGRDDTIVIEIAETVGVEQPQTTEKKLRILLTGLNQEAKNQDLSQYQGFTTEVISDLALSSNMTPTGQLVYVLQKINLTDIQKFELRAHLNHFILELLNVGSQLSRDLEGLKTLTYLSYP